MALTASGSYEGGDVDRVRVVATYDDGGTGQAPKAWTVERLEPAPRRPVRGWSATPGTFSVVADDWEVVPGPNLYRVAAETGSVAFPFTWEAFVTVTVPDLWTRREWLKDPARPAASRNVWVESWSESTTDRPGESVVPANGRFPVTALGERTGRTFTLNLFTLSADERAGLLTLLDAPRPLLLTAPTARLPGGAVWFTVGKVSERRVGAFAGEPARRWALDCTEVAPPVDLETVGTRGLTWGDVAAGHASWSALVVDRPSWLDVLERG